MRARVIQNGKHRKCSLWEHTTYAVVASFYEEKQPKIREKI